MSPNQRKAQRIIQRYSKQLEELQLKEIKENEVVLLNNMEDEEEISNEKKEHIETLKKSRLGELIRSRKARQKQMAEIQKKRDDEIRNAASRYFQLEPGKIVDWNAIVEAKRKKIREHEKYLEDKRKKEEGSP